MSKTQPTGASRQANRAILTATLAFSLAALAGLGALLLALPQRRLAAAVVTYALSLVACSLCSFLYNMLETARRRRLLRHLDHAAIFLLIAGTYTPFAASGVAGPFGAPMLQTVWVLALAGIGLKLALRGAGDRLFVALYIALGWLFLSAVDQFVAAIPPSALALLAIGGIAYTVGGLIYARDIGRWTDPVWHGCVLAGAVTHCLAVAALLLEGPTLGS